jgi:hypothetical protein
MRSGILTLLAAIAAMVLVAGYFIFAPGARQAIQVAPVAAPAADPPHPASLQRRPGVMDVEKSHPASWPLAAPPAAPAAPASLVLGRLAR